MRREWKRFQCQASAMIVICVGLRRKFIMCTLKAIIINYREKFKCEIKNQRMCVKCKFGAAKEWLKHTAFQMQFKPFVLKEK
jgi:hypothetical protein